RHVVGGNQIGILVSHLKHLADGSNPGNRLFAEGSDTIADSSEKLAVDIHWASAHTGDYTRVLGLRAFKPSKNHVLSWTVCIVKKAQDLHAHRLRLHTLEDCIRNAVQSAMYLVYWIKACG